MMKNNYTVVNCGENTDHVHDLLTKLRTALLPAILDARSLPPSIPFTTFFKTPLYKPFISTLIANVSTGAPMTARSLYSMRGGVSFFCVTAPGQFSFELDNNPRDSYDDCKANPQTTTYFPIFQPPQPFVIICPSFFTSNIAALPPPNHCLSVNTLTNRFRGNGESLWLYQMWILMSMITHYYLWTSTQVADFLSENDVNTLYGLSSSQARLSVNSYVYYAASKSFSIFLFIFPPPSFRTGEQGMEARAYVGAASEELICVSLFPPAQLGIYGNCRRFPRPSYDGNREILEVVDTAPAANESLVPGPTAVEWNATDLRIDGQAI